ncbi:MAG: 2-oxoacid:acceptor oxidoreductase family protein [Dehalococcoidia bacterium]|nr:2-oxoacid:acceptor oxidoreductase family protein [Dehalococcoidia bacterium]
MKNTTGSPDNKARFEIRLAGSGGQGVILAGIILAEASTLEGKYSAHSQTYGPEARGGSSRSDVVLSDSEIDYPWSMESHILVALTQESYDQNVPNLNAEGLIIVDSDMVHRVHWKKCLSIPFRRIARDLGEERAINMAVLGAVAAFCPFISRKSLLQIIEKRLPPSKLDPSIQAFDKSMELAKRSNISNWDNKDKCEI